MEHITPQGHFADFNAVSKRVKTVYLVRESLANIYEPSGILPYFVATFGRTFTQFPNLQTIHLPDPSAIDLTVSDDGEFASHYKTATRELAKTGGAELQNWNTITDQDVWPL